MLYIDIGNDNHRFYCVGSNIRFQNHSIAASQSREQGTYFKSIIIFHIEQVCNLTSYSLTYKSPSFAESLFVFLGGVIQKGGSTNCYPLCHRAKYVTYQATSNNTPGTPCLLNTSTPNYLTSPFITTQLPKCSGYRQISTFLQITHGTTQRLRTDFKQPISTLDTMSDVAGALFLVLIALICELPKTSPLIGETNEVQFHLLQWA